MVKEFSSMGTVTELSEETESPVQKSYSQAEVRERLREAKLGPRMLMRRKVISYKQVVKSMGGVGNIKEEDLKILKSLFASDILNILNSVVPDVIKSNKQLNTTLGLSALGKVYRQAGQNLQMPLRMAMVEVGKNGFVSKMRFQKLKENYTEFVQAIMSDVFGENPEPIPAEDEEMNNEENNK